MSFLQEHPDMEELLLECSMSTPTFGSTFMPKRFWRPWVSLHDEFFQYLDDDSVPLLAIAAPRGFGKTSIDTIAYPAKKILFQETKFVEVISCTASVAATNVKNLGRELTSNPMIAKIFGRLKGPVWSEGLGNLETSTGVVIKARGAGQQVRGLIEGENRPDLIIIDDLEDSEPFRIGDPTEYLRKIKEWFFSDLMNSIDRRGRTRVIVIGTILHEDSLLANLLDDPDWKSVRLELCDDNYKSNYPDLMTTEEVRKLATSLAEKGMLDTFYREYRNLAIAAEDAVFKRESFKYLGIDCKETAQEVIDDLSVERLVIVDPAKTTNIKSAYTAIVGLGYDPRRKRICLLDCVNKRMEPDEIYEQSYEMARRLRTTIIAVKVTSLNLFITYPFNTYLSTKGYPNVEEVKETRNKLERIRELAPIYRMGFFWHHSDGPDKGVNAALEAQLCTFPRSKFLDVADCVADVIPLLSLSNRLFGMSEQEDEKSFEEEIRMMDDEEDEIEPLDIHWRWAP